MNVGENNISKPYSAFKEQTFGRKREEPQLKTMESDFQKWQKFPKENQRSRAMMDKNVEQIVLDDQPPSVINVWFRFLSEHLEQQYSSSGWKRISETTLFKQLGDWQNMFHVC